MQTSQASMLASLTNVQHFLDEHAAKLGGLATGPARTRLDDVVKELTAHVAEQSGSDFAAQGLTKKQRSLRQALIRDHMAPISRIARADLPDTPEVHPLKMPRGNPGTGKLVSHARGMAKAALPFSNVFVLGGLPADFTVRLDAATDALLQAGSDRSRNHGRRGGATKGLRQRLSAGRKIVRVIDALVKSVAATDPVLVADWNIVKRVQRTGVRSGSTTTAPATPVAVTPVAPAQ
jgi:hypothetical protein